MHTNILGLVVNIVGLAVVIGAPVLIIRKVRCYLRRW